MKMAAFNRRKQRLALPIQEVSSILNSGHSLITCAKAWSPSTGAAVATVMPSIRLHNRLRADRFMGMPSPAIRPANCRAAARVETRAGQGAGQGA